MFFTSTWHISDHVIVPYVQLFDIKSYVYTKGRYGHWPLCISIVALKNKCVELMKFDPDLVECSPGSTAICNNDNNIIYIPGYDGIYKINLDTKIMEMITIEQCEEYKWSYGKFI